MLAAMLGLRGRESEALLDALADLSKNQGTENVVFYILRTQKGGTCLWILWKVADAG